MFSNVPITTMLVASAAGVLGSYCVCRFLRETKVKLPSEWRLVGTLKQIYLYLVKSCGAVSVESGQCTLLGLKDGWLIDRNLMVVDGTFNFVSARTNAELLRVTPSLNNSLLTLSHPTLGTVSVDLAEVKATQKPRRATVWYSEVKVYECGFDASQFFSKCTLITRDPKTGVGNPENEPLRTLKRYRQIENEEVRKAFNEAPRMGLQIALRSAPGGTVSLQDAVYVA